MKVDELRKIIKDYSIENKDKIIIELYKKIPKSVKEDYNIDKYIQNINLKIDKVHEKESFEELQKEIEYFLDCVWDNLYCQPNRIISKDERSKWRFKVKKFYKKLNDVKVNTDNGKKATELLSEIYKTLSYGSNYLLFSSWNTFGSIQVAQSDFLRNIVDRKLCEGVTKENIKDCIDLLEAKLDPQEYHKNVLKVIENSLNIPDSKYLAIEILKEKVGEWKNKYNKDSSYDNEDQLNSFVECVVYMYFNLYEVDKGIKYFQKEYVYKQKEIKEYILLEIIEEYGFYKEWINEYEKHIGKIDYRDSLKEKYSKFSKTHKKIYKMYREVNMEIKKLEKYLIKKYKTDMISSLKKVDMKIVNEKIEEYDVNSIEELAEIIIEEFKEILRLSKDDIFTQMFFERLVHNENSSIFSAYEQDVEHFTVFAYDSGEHYSYYIPDEIRKIIRDELDL